jgi:hypothetical protein
MTLCNVIFKATWSSHKILKNRSTASPFSNRYFSEYYAIQSQHKSWDKTVKNRNMISDFPRGDALAIFFLHHWPQLFSSSFTKTVELSILSVYAVRKSP